MTRLILFLVILTLVGSCKKDNISVHPLASLTVANVVVDGKAIKVSSYLSDSAAINSSRQFGLKSGPNSFYMFPSGDSLHPYYQGQRNVNAGELLTAFVTGNTPSNVDVIIVSDPVALAFSDSICGVRIANMSPDNTPITITQVAQPTLPEFENVLYKGVTAFKQYPALISNGSYQFQIRDANTSDIIGTYTLVTPRFRSVTLIWKGTTGGVGNNSRGVLRVNHY